MRIGEMSVALMLVGENKKREILVEKYKFQKMQVELICYRNAACRKIQLFIMQASHH
jgi:hypothetical protein